MNKFVERITQEGLQREEWHFDLHVDWGSSSVIYFDDYSLMTKESSRHRKWNIKGHWSRTMSRDNTVKNPPLPDDVVAEAREYFIKCIASLPIKQ